MNIVFGASGFAHEVDWIACDIARDTGERFVPDLFVVEDDSDLIGSNIGSRPVVGESEVFGRFGGSSVNCFVAVGVPAIKRAIAAKIEERMPLAVFPNLVHPTVIFDQRDGQLSLGKGGIFYPYVVISCNVTIGDFVTVNIKGVVGHDSTIGDYCQLSPGVSVGGWVEINDCVTLGTNASVLPKAVVGEGAVVGAGSVVLRNVPSGLTVFGVPARPVPLPTMIPGKDGKDNL